MAQASTPNGATIFTGISSDPANVLNQFLDSDGHFKWTLSDTTVVLDVSPEGDIRIHDLLYPAFDGASGWVLTTDGFGDLSFQPVPDSGGITGSGTAPNVPVWTSSSTLGNAFMNSQVPSSGLNAGQNTITITGEGMAVHTFRVGTSDSPSQLAQNTNGNLTVTDGIGIMGYGGGGLTATLDFQSGRRSGGVGPFYAPSLDGDILAHIQVIATDAANLDQVGALLNIVVDSAPTNGTTPMAWSFQTGPNQGTLAERLRISSAGKIIMSDLKTTGAAAGKKVVCVDTATGQLYASSTGTDCS